MPFVINLNPSAASWYLHSLTARDGLIAVGRSGGDVDAAWRFDSFEQARAVAVALRGWPDARVEEVGAPTEPLPMPAHFTRTLTRAHALRLCIVYSAIARNAADGWHNGVVRALHTPTKHEVDDAVAMLRDQSNCIATAQALASLVENEPCCVVTTDNVEVDKIDCDYCDGTLRIGEYRSEQFSRLMTATEQPLPLGELLHLAAPSHHP